MNDLITIIEGDCLTSLKTLPDECVQCCVTSPPYWGLRDYGVEGQLGLEKTPEEYVSKMIEVFREVRRVLCGNGTLWLNLGDSYASGDRATYRSGASDNKGQHIQNDMPRAKTPPGLKPKDMVGIPWLVAFALCADGWWLRQDIIWHKPNPMPESVTDRCTKSHEYIFLMTKSASYYYDQDAIREPSKDPEDDFRRIKTANEAHKTMPTGQVNGLRPRSWNGSAFHDWKNAQVHPNVGKNRARLSDDPKNYGMNTNQAQGVYGDRTTHEFGRNKRSVWTVPSSPYPEAHFATFPPDLIKPCVLAGTKPGDVVLDPFGGSFTTGAVAIEFGRRAIMCELNPEYIEMGKRRCDITPGLALA